MHGESAVSGPAGSAEVKIMSKNKYALQMRGVAVGVAAMTVIVTGSNIAVQFPINDWLTWGALTYPISFLVTDLTNRALGPAKARRVVYAGFALAVALSIYFATWRIALASGTAWINAGRSSSKVGPESRRRRAISASSRASWASVARSRRRRSSSCCLTAISGLSLYSTLDS